MMRHGVAPMEVLPLNISFRALYSAIEGVNLPPDTPIDINTLSDILYMDQINDVSFTIDNRLVVLIDNTLILSPDFSTGFPHTMLSKKLEF